MIQFPKLLSLSHLAETRSWQPVVIPLIRSLSHSQPIRGLLLSRSPRPELLVHRSAQLLIGDVEVSLRRLQVGMTEEQLNRSQVEPFREPAAGGFVAQVVPMQVDLGELLAVDAAVRARACRLNAVREQNDRCAASTSLAGRQI